MCQNPMPVPTGVASYVALGYMPPQLQQFNLSVHLKDAQKSDSVCVRLLSKHVCSLR